MDVMRDLAKRLARCGHNVAHSYVMHNPICTYSQAHCDMGNVYHEQLTHPAPGYLSNNDPIANNDVGFAELGIPGPFDDGGDIVFHVDKQNFRHENETLPGHVFHYGKVTRSTSVLGSTLLISTV